MTISFDGRVAIVTGAGGGLGRCHAIELAKLGAKVVVNDLGGAMDGTGGSSEAARRASSKRSRAAGGQAIANGGSVSDVRGAKSMVEDAMKAWGRVDILINNAGILRDKSFTKMTIEDFRAVVEVHLMGSMYCTKEVWPIMREQDYGRIVMTTSPSGSVRQLRPNQLRRGETLARRVHELAEDRRRARTTFSRTRSHPLLRRE